MTEADGVQTSQSGVLGWIERTGNRLPDPVFIFVWLIAGLVVFSVFAAAINFSALHPTQKAADGSSEVIAAVSLLAPDNIARLWVDMPTTFTHFHPLGYVLVVMLGAGIAERSGLFATAMHAGVRNAPKFLLTPVVALVAMLGNLAADAAYVVLIPLAGVLYAAAGRHPIAGIAASFAGVSGGFSANLLPGQLDALLFGITEAAAEAMVPSWDSNIAGNWYFIAAMTFVFLPVIWWVTDRKLEPRLGPYQPEGSAAAMAEGDKPITPEERKGLVYAGLAALGCHPSLGVFHYRAGHTAVGRNRTGDWPVVALLSVPGCRLFRLVSRLWMGLWGRRGHGQGSSRHRENDVRLNG